uniref:Uncharacterized protein n=1 Tax=Caenorhabditis japonica TaxID=281687 RepID=A0A8R1HSP0_CAEJA
MSKQLFRRFTFQHKEDLNHSMRDSGDNASKLVKSLLKTLEAYMNAKTPEKLADIGMKVDVVWHSVFDTEKATAPRKKYELAEEMLIRPDVLKLLLVAFRLVQIDVKRKIRDLYQFIIIWCSNDSTDSSVPRSRAKVKFSPKVRDQLFYCRAELIEIVVEGYDEPNSVDFYNDIIREYVKDDVCLMTLLEDEGRDHSGFATRKQGCVWEIFDRLTLTDGRIYPFDVTVATFDTLQLIFGNNHDAVHAFMDHHFDRFCQCVQKLIASSNFYVQAKSLRLLHDIFTTQRHFEIRSRWLAQTSFLRLVTLALLSNQKPVRAEAVTLLELIIENPHNSKPIKEFISKNKKSLITYCFDSSPVHYYRGNRIEAEDARFSRMAHKLLTWDQKQPISKKEEDEFMADEKLQQKMREEQTVPTTFQDFVEGLPTVSHEFHIQAPREMSLLREPMKFGVPPMAEKLQ